MPQKNIQLAPSAQKGTVLAPRRSCEKGVWLIRNCGSERHALDIDSGIIGCRDLLSYLLTDIESGYQFTNYREKVTIQARNSLLEPFDYTDRIDRSSARLLDLLRDELIEGTYLTYFHTFDPKTTPTWLEQSDKDHMGHYVYVRPHFSYGRCVCGQNGLAFYVGAPMRYVARAEDIDIRETSLRVPGIIVVIGDSETFGTCSQERILLHHEELLYSMSPLFNRVVDSTFGDVEREFRYLFRKKRAVHDAGVRIERRRNRRVRLENGEELEVAVRYVENNPEDNLFAGPRAIQYVLVNPESGNPVGDLSGYLAFGERVEVVPDFAPMNIEGTCDEYGYIGNWEDCRRFVADLSSGARHPKVNSRHINKRRHDELLAINAHPREFAEDPETVVLRPPGENVYRS